jgi:hypothetical protein
MVSLNRSHDWLKPNGEKDNSEGESARRYIWEVLLPN